MPDFLRPAGRSCSCRHPAGWFRRSVPGVGRPGDQHQRDSGGGLNRTWVPPYGCVQLSSCCRVEQCGGVRCVSPSGSGPGRAGQMRSRPAKR
ncbi:hypothetical protein PK34_06440 [Stutzerimonas stutzeri]|nr:hypothetical protein PK34_06440 [Stutzerimonas stutzeri]